ncbi:hypothetical protein PYW08_009376 [Mythimna loreyi]|uniref:Uncharacterized protein n=1 Tax=Mythimna loreyi TaxID=667449 RepID=A0ACC2Q9B0_9NEOP|nr:hypothetical protein PYW08_009376 [Mythimna loreyi]
MAYSLDRIVLLVCGAVGLVLAYSGPDLPPGPYCGINNQCCKDRQDSCSHRILDSKCYCDQFCNRTAGHDDCCPDYPSVCLGIPDPTPPPAQNVRLCKYGDDFYQIGEKVTQDCHTCECMKPPEGGDEKFVCDKDPCLLSDDVLRNVNQNRLGWRAENYTQFRGKKLKDGLIYKLGTLPLNRETARLGPINIDKDIQYPREFDARTHWRNYISPVMDQGWCGSDWAVSLATIVSDRFAIQSNGAEKVLLSPQTLLSCNLRQQQGCRGGNIDTAWMFAKNHGLVDEACFPYMAKITKCHFKKRGNLLTDRCVPVVPQRTSRYKVGPPGRLVKEHDVMFDIMQSGPVQAIMTVYQDFFHYKDGIYRRSQFGNNELKGLHSVRVVGWGEENGDKYWIVANSWGTQWGEDGYFRIARGENESGIESFVVTVLSDVTEAYLRK